MLFVPCITSAQSLQKELMSIVTIDDINLVNNSTLEFSITLKRTSLTWERWANGTFQVKIDGISEERYDDSRMRVELISGTSQLPLEPYVNQQMISYSITPRLYLGRISITIAGPDEFQDTRTIPQDTTLRIGRFRVVATDGGRLNQRLAWATPLDFYQANAYKLEIDSTEQNLQWFASNDNIEQRNYPSIKLNRTTIVRVDSFRVNAAPLPCLTLRDSSFEGQYLGEMLVKLKWATTCENNVQGFILRRRVVGTPGLRPSDLEFVEIRRFGRPLDTVLISKGNSPIGFEYELAVPDTVDYRDVLYEYELSALTFDGSRRYLDTTQVQIPNSIISSALAFPNPVTRNKTTKIRYRIEDKALMSAKVYDILGKEVAVLLEQQTLLRTPSDDWYSIDWNVPEAASQGLYNVVITANPINDPSVEVSRAILKIQVLR